MKPKGSVFVLGAASYHVHSAHACVFTYMCTQILESIELPKLVVTAQRGVGERYPSTLEFVYMRKHDKHGFNEPKGYMYWEHTCY